MAKISIPVNPRDLREVLQSALELVPSAKIPGLLRTLEKIAVQTSSAAPFEIRVSALHFVNGQWEVHPRSEDLHKESVVISVLHGSERRVLMALHSNLYGQLFTVNSEPQKEAVNRPAEVKKTQTEPGAMLISAVHKKSAAMGAATANGTGATPISSAAQPPAQDGKAVEKIRNDNVQGGPSSGDKRVAISERNLFLATKKALEGLEFGDLLSLNRSVLDAVDALKSGGSRPALKGAKRLVWHGHRLSFELENDEPMAVSLVRGLLAGLGFSALMQLHGEFSSRMNVARSGARKAAADAVKAT
jgi:hypothetical protein